MTTRQWNKLIISSLLILLCVSVGVDLAYAATDPYEDPWNDVQSKPIFSRRIAHAAGDSRYATDPDFGTATSDKAVLMKATQQGKKEGTYVLVNDSAKLARVFDEIVRKTKLRLLPQS